MLATSSATVATGQASLVAGSSCSTTRRAVEHRPGARDDVGLGVEDGEDQVAGSITPARSMASAASCSLPPGKKWYTDPFGAPAAVTTCFMPVPV